VFAVGSGAGSKSVINVYDGTSNAFLYSITPAIASTGGLRTAVGQMNSDGVADIVAGFGPGSQSFVFVFNGVNGAEIGRTLAFEESFLGGTFVAVGDVNNDRIDDIAVSPDQGGGGRVRIIDGATGTNLGDFFGIEDESFRGGARVAMGDVNGDGFLDLIVAAGFGGGPRVAVFDGRSIRPGVTPVKLFADFFVFEQSLRNGIFVASGDLNADGNADLIFGGGPGGGPRVFALSGKELVGSAGQNPVQVANFFAGDTTNRNGVVVSVKNLDDDNKIDVVTAPGGTSSTVTSYLGKNIAAANQPPVFESFSAFEAATGPIFVG